MFNSLIKHFNIKDLIGGLILTIAFICIVDWFQTVRIWPNYYFTPSVLYILYHVFKTLLFFYLVCIIFTAGKLIVSLLSRKIGLPQLSSLEMFIIYTFVGASFLQILMFILGILKLYYTTTALIVTVPLVFLSFSHLRHFYNYLKENLPSYFKEIKEEGVVYTVVFISLCVITILQFIYVFISKGLIPDLQITDTLTNYLPYYQHVIDTHGNFFSKYWFHFYISKGASLFYLLSLLSDIQSVQLVGFFYYLMSAILVFSLILRFVPTYKELWALFGFLLVFSSFFLLNELIPLTEVGRFGLISIDFSKTHNITSTYMLFLVWLTTIFITNNQRITNIQAIMYLSVVIIALSIVSTLSGGWTAPFFAILTIVLVLKKEGKSNYLVMLSGFIVSVIAVCAILIFNLLTSGLAEHSPFILFNKYSIPEIINKWNSKIGIEFAAYDFELSGHYEGPISKFRISRLLYNLNYIFYDDSMLPLMIYTIIFIIAILLLNNYYVFVPIIVLCILNLIYLTIHGHDSVYRYMLPIIISIKSFFYVLVLSYIVNFSNKYKKEVFISLLSVCLIFLITSIFNQKTILTIDDKINFLTGKFSYVDVYNKRWGSNIAKNILSVINNSNEKVLTLTEMFGVIVTPGGQFQMPFFADFVTKTDDFLSLITTEDTEKIKNIFQKYKINYFLILFSTRPFGLFYLPIFEKESLRDNFRLLAYGKNLILLTLHNKGERINEKLLEVIELYRERNKDWCTFKAYYNFRNAVRSNKYDYESLILAR